MMGGGKAGRRSTHRRGWTEQTHSTDEDAEEESTPDRLDENKHGFLGGGSKN